MLDFLNLVNYQETIVKTAPLIISNFEIID